MRAAAAALFAAVAIAACGEQTREPVAQRALGGRVVAVADGDTIRVRLDSGRVERVRYIGIDTPETDKPGTPGECFAERAREFNQRLVGDREVRLVLDAERRDRYDRLLAYVRAGSTDVNAELLREGFAVPLVVPPNVRFAARFDRLARAARRAGKGLWAAC
jgi:micrococcal nuclease